MPSQKKLQEFSEMYTFLLQAIKQRYIVSNGMTDELEWICKEEVVD
jgi:hypothetical protein